MGADALYEPDGKYSQGFVDDNLCNLLTKGRKCGINIISYKNSVREGDKVENLLTCRIKAMFDKIEEGDASYYNDLAEIVYGFLKPRIRAWCSRDSRLKGKQLEDDLLNDAYLIISKKIVTHFLRRNGFDAPINNDPEGFLKWMTTVAANHVKNEAEKQGRRQTVSIEPPEDDDGATRYEYKELSTEDFDAEIDGKRELISSALDVVLDKRSEPYIILSWLTVSIYVLENNVQNHVAIRMIVDEMSDKTLFEIKDRVFEYFIVLPQK